MFSQKTDKISHYVIGVCKRQLGFEDVIHRHVLLYLMNQTDSKPNIYEVMGYFKCANINRFTT